MNRIFFVALICCVDLVMNASAEETEATAQPLKQEELTPEAQAIANDLRSAYSPDSEAIAMLNAIVNGSTLKGDDGWFAQARAQSRFDWDYVCQTYDANGDGVLQADEFRGSEEEFARLDRNSDGSVTEPDFDWTRHSLNPTPGYMLFFKADRDGNGKVTRAEWSELFGELAADEGPYLTLDDLRDELAPPSPGERERRADRPSRNTLVVGLKNQEIGSLQPGPNLGEPAPDFTLPTLDGQAVTLSEQVREKPTVLVFGNFTCGPFRSQSGNLERLYRRYRDRANFYLVYVREAHPRDGWWMLSNQRVGIDLTQPKSGEERCSVAANCRQHLDLEIPFLVDTLDDRVGTAYSGMPNRLYLIDQQGRIAFKNGRGPFGFHPRQLEQALILLLNERQ